MIKLIVKGKEKLYSNKKGIKILRKGNPHEQFRIAICQHTKKEIIQIKELKEWVCLHD